MKQLTTWQQKYKEPPRFEQLPQESFHNSPKAYSACPLFRKDNRKPFVFRKKNSF